MMILRRAAERHHARRRRQDEWHTFSADDRSDALAGGFGALQILNEELLPPGARIPRIPLHPRLDSEILSYVFDGAVAYEDATGGSGIIHAGEFQRMSGARGGSHSETNASRTHWAHVFQIWLRSAEAGLEPTQEQKRFSAAQRRGVLCVIASADGRRGSLRIHQDALVCSAILDPGQHLIHELLQRRAAWLHVVKGEVTLGEVVLSTGDGAGITDERAVSLTARGETEILLVDLAEPARTSGQHGGTS